MVNKLSTYYINIYKSICGPFWNSNVDSSIEMSARGTASWVCSWMVIVPLQLAGALLMLRLNGHGKSWDVIFDFKPTINMRIIEDIWYIYMIYIYIWYIHIYIYIWYIYMRYNVILMMRLITNTRFGLIQEYGGDTHKNHPVFHLEDGPWLPYAGGYLQCIISRILNRIAHNDQPLWSSRLTYIYIY